MNYISMSTERTRALFNAVPEPVVLVEFVDCDPIVRACNETFTRQFGYAADAIVGESLNDYIVPPGDAHRESAARIDEAAAAGETIEQEITRRTADGTRDFLFRAVPFEEGATVKSIGIYVDITERHRERQRYEALIEHSSDIVTILDADGTIRYESPSVERILGYDPADLVGTSAFEYIHPDDRSAVVTEFERGLTDPERHPNIEYRFRAADGSWRWLASIGSNHVDHEPIDGYVVNSRDVTERRERERKLEWYRTYIRYQQTERELNEVKVEVSVLEAEYTADELAAHQQYQTYSDRLDALSAELDELEAELDQLEATYDDLPDADEFTI